LRGVKVVTEDNLHLKRVGVAYVGLYRETQKKKSTDIGVISRRKENGKSPFFWEKMKCTKGPNVAESSEVP